MPSVGETGWGQLVSQNFAILDGVSNITSITTRFTITSTQPITISSASFIEYDNYPFDTFTTTSYGFLYSPTNTNILSSAIISPTVSLRYFVIYIDGNLTLAGTIDTYPSTLKTETPPNSTTTNTLAVQKFGYVCDSLTSAMSKTNGAVTMNIQEPYPGAYLDFYSRQIGITPTVVVNIPHAIAAGGTGNGNGAAGTTTNTCNGGGGGGGVNIDGYVGPRGGTGCIFGQYAGGSFGQIGIGYGDNSSAKYRCAIIFVVRGNLVISGNINLTGGGAHGYSEGNYGGFGGGGGGLGQGTSRVGSGGGGGAPVFIYYSGTYTNNGSINTAGGSKVGSGAGGNGGAGGIKLLKISL